MNRIALKILALVVVAIGALTPTAAVAGHSDTTYTGTSANGATMTLRVTGGTVLFTVANDPCGQSASGQATIDGSHRFAGQAGHLFIGGWFSETSVQGFYQFMRCPDVSWTAKKPCDCADTRAFATWYNVGGRFDNNRLDIRHVKLHLVVECDAGDGADCSGWAQGSVSGATAVPAKIQLSCKASDKCPERMEATKIVKIRRQVARGAGSVTITVKHACTNGATKTTTLTIRYNRGGWVDRGASDLNGDGSPDRIS